jgi:site-specific DNA recombinase
MSLMIVAYARVSTDRQAEQQTIEQQVSALCAYAADHGWSLDAAHIYRDEGYSGTRLDRPGLDRLRDAVARGLVDRILITSPDRLARRYAYQVWLLEEFERTGCVVTFLERPLTGDPQDALVIPIRGAVAEYERTVIADRMRRGRLAALRAGRLLPWSQPPYGYRLDPQAPRDPTRVQVDAEQAAVIREIFAWDIDEGLTLYGIALRLTKMQIPTARGAAIWNASSIRKILKNHTYTGTAYGNQIETVPAQRRHPLINRTPKTAGGESYRLRPPEEWIAIPVPAIVTAEEFTAAQQRLARNQAWSARKTQGEYLLRRLVSCQRCGLAHRVQNKRGYVYYRCSGQDTQVMRGRPNGCHARNIRVERLDGVVWEDLCALLRDPAILEEALRRTQEGWLTSDGMVSRQHDLQQRQRHLERQIARLIDAYTAGVITLDELQTRRTAIDQRRAALQREGQELVASATHQAQVATILAQAETFRALVSQGLEHATFAQRRALVELLIERVVVDAPEVEIRYILPLTGLAQRNGVLRSRHRATESGTEAPHPGDPDFPEPGCVFALGDSVVSGAE